TASAARLPPFGLRRGPARARRLIRLLPARLRPDLEARDLLRRQKTVSAGPQSFVAQVADGHATKLQDRVADRVEHAAYLLVAPRCDVVRQFAVVRQNQKALGVEVEATDGV